MATKAELETALAKRDEEIEQLNNSLRLAQEDTDRLEAVVHAAETRPSVPSERFGAASRLPTDEFVRMCREPFAEELIGKKPIAVAKDGAKSECGICGQYLPWHQHIDYVGHAVVTDRLYQIDPTWNWEPMALDAQGLPALIVTETGVALWIRLTLNGFTRTGIGTAAKKSGQHTLKICVSDALKNAAMRFGIALDLWSKEDLEFVMDDVPAAAPDRSQAPSPQDDVLLSDRQVEYFRRRMKDETPDADVYSQLALALSSQFDVSSTAGIRADDFNRVDKFLDDWTAEHVTPMPTPAQEPATGDPGPPEEPPPAEQADTPPPQPEPQETPQEPEPSDPEAETKAEEIREEIGDMFLGMAGDAASELEEELTGRGFWPIEDIHAAHVHEALSIAFIARKQAEKLGKVTT